MPFPQIIIVIPCYNEPDVLQTLQSLYACQRGDFGVEIILLINSYTHTPEAILEINRNSYQEALEFAALNDTTDFRLDPLLKENLPGKNGAGLPRKIGMDEAAARFYKAGNPEGIIVSLDADCTVEANYLTEIFHNFRKDKLCSVTIEFHHPIAHLPEKDPLRQAMTEYENYLRYYRAALEYCGYPYAYYTIGSAFAVTADTYTRAGGMGKQQAGEDFYFLQKVFPIGRTKFIDTTRVYPAARLSDRVPFGTGPALAQLAEGDTIVKYTYCFESFQVLNCFFEKINSFFKSSSEEIKRAIEDLPVFFLNFLQQDDFLEKMKEINQYTASLPAYRKRFFNYFNAFKILKYLNYVHPAYFSLSEAGKEYARLLSYRSLSTSPSSGTYS